MKSEQEIKLILKDLRSEISTPLCMKCDKVLMARVGTLLWVLDREDESIEGKL